VRVCACLGRVGGGGWGGRGSLAALAGTSPLACAGTLAVIDRELLFQQGGSSSCRSSHAGGGCTLFRPSPPLQAHAQVDRKQFKKHLRSALPNAKFGPGALGGWLGARELWVQESRQLSVALMGGPSTLVPGAFVGRPPEPGACHSNRPRRILPPFPPLPPCRLPL